MDTIRKVFSVLSTNARLWSPGIRPLIVDFAMFRVADYDGFASIEDPKSFVEYLTIDFKQRFGDSCFLPMGVNRHQ